MGGLRSGWAALAAAVSASASAADSGAAPGDPDPTFGSSGNGRVTTRFGSSAEARAIAVQPDGRIVVVGSGTGADGDFALARYRPDGTLDRSFGRNGKVRTPLGGEDRALAVALQRDGRIVVAGERVLGMEDTDFVVVRYTASGRLDRTFSSDGRVTTTFGDRVERAVGVAVQRDGKIVAAGTSGGDFALARYRPNGALDPSFDADGKVTTGIGPGQDDASALELQPNGRIVVAGSALVGSNFEFALARYRADGAPDMSLDSDGKLTTPIGSGDAVGRALALQPDGRIVVAGFAIGTNADFALARYRASGALDTSFGTDGTVTTTFGDSGGVEDVFALTVQPDGRILAAGQAEVDVGTVVDDVALLARYEPTGSLDTSFGFLGATFDQFNHPQAARAVAVRPNGRIVVAGQADEGTRQEFVLFRYLGSHPRVSVGDAARAEGDRGTRALRFAVRLSTPPGSTPVRVRYATVEQTALAPQDFRARAGTLTFGREETVKFLRVPIVGDRRHEGRERFRVALVAATNATLADARATGTIRDDD